MASHHFSGGGRLVCIHGVNTIRVLAASLVLLLLSLPASAQLNLGRIFGAITDQSGASIPGDRH